MDQVKSNHDEGPGINTRSIHHGESFASETGTVMPPIFPSATFAHGNLHGFDYTRSGNPNFRILESVLSSVESCKYVTVLASGVSAITAIVSTLEKGDLVLCEENLYGCTVRLFEEVFRRFDIKTVWVDFTDEKNFSKIIDLKPKMIWLESPTNPMLKVIDIAAICDYAIKVKAPVVVDNTFATPLFQRPLELGATLSLCSTTKYINGHSDALGGAICSEDATWKKKLDFAQKALGLQPSPFDCWLITRGIKTMPLRVERQSKNAFAIAQQLLNHPGIEWVRYPFLSSHPQYEIALKQMKAGGSIITLKINATQNQTYEICKSLNYFTMAESLGGIESLVCHPASMTHAYIDRDTKLKLGIDDGLIRLSIGCEDLKDLTDDLMQALETLKK
ncbi:PLP-dependent aspartate aminotransferase family protein [Prochlorococcus sp. MIT 1341]|uniref:trans-sulfuration enzyme family protein n=1 Tax=Prochlorococcus sp. MIT 1341 TaxID=3096221 RepID=UPI002A755A22|nr:PLP-dependent aspartate aminotransferase family protein [Prochlorococcus sp. MIT 1341]